jgi:glucose-6-phosphate 1-dehydrogenase
MTYSSSIPASILVIVGISGNLAKRRLLPALEKIAQAGQLPVNFRLLGITRRDLKVDDILQNLGNPEDFPALRQYLELFQMDLNQASEYQRLAEHLEEMSHGFAQETQRLFYLSIPPQISGGIIRQLGESGLAQMKNTKLLLEKPFGTDLASAEDLISTTSQHFREEQIYRIDHYLAKEMAQNILVFRNGNSLFKKTWNSSFIEKIDILATESIGIEGRNIFYEQTGALRDVLQSHLLQLAALTLMELPSNDDWSRVSELRLAALKQLELPQPGLFYHYVKRGQYQGYREEVENPKSQVETFVSMTLFSNNQRWQNVPITLTTGKALDKRLTEIRVSYRKQEDNEANQLIFRIQPDEGIALQLWSKKPGYEHRVEQVKLSFAYEDHQQELAQAYEQVLIDALKGDHRLFTSSEEVLASWKILAPVQKQWALEEKDLIFYEAGSSLQQVCQKMN